ASETGFEQAVAAPSTLANSSIIPQFSGPFIPRPAETTISASGREILSVARTISLTITLKSWSFRSGVKSTISAEPPVSFKSKAFGLTAITLTAELITSVAKALLENAVFLTSICSPLKVGRLIAPSAKPASSLAATLGPNPFPLNELERTTTFAFSYFAADAIMDAYALFTKFFIVSWLASKTLDTPYLPNFSNSDLSTFPMERAVTVSPN